MLNTNLYYFLLLVVVGAPFFFQYRMQNAVKELDSLPAINSLCAKLSALILLILYTMSFLSYEIKNSAYSKVGFCACFLSLYLLYSFRGKLIHQIREIPASPKERFQKSFRTFLAMSLLYGIYFFTVHFLVPYTGTIPAISVALIFITYSTPLFVRIWMPTQKMHPSIIKEEMMQVFASAKNPVHEVYLIDTDRFKSYNALVCGPKYGFGPLRRSLFITKNLFEALEPEEIRAVICHEAAHFKLHHIFKRGCMSIVALIVSLLCVFFPISFISILMNMTIDKNFAFLIVSTVATIVVQLSFIYRVIRKQEFEADLEAITIGATPIALASALTKLTDKNGASKIKESWISRFMSQNAHPHIDDRLQAIKAGKLPDNSRILPPWKYTLAYTSFVIALGAFTVIDFDSKNHHITERKVASLNEIESGQKLPTSENKLEDIDLETEK